MENREYMEYKEMLCIVDGGTDKYAVTIIEWQANKKIMDKGKT